MAEDSAEACSAAGGLGDHWRQSVLISRFRKASALDVLHRGDGGGLPKPARRWVVLFLTSLLAAAQSVEGAGNPRPLSRQALMYTSEQSDINCLVSKS